jgi:transcription antitermination factor NusA-like protein
MKLLLSENAPGGGEMTIYVHPRDLSKALGQKRKNIELLKAEGWQVTIRPAPQNPQGSVDTKEW